MKRIITFLFSFLFIWIFSVGIINAEEKEILTESQKEVIENTVFVHNVSVDQKHIVINNFPESSLSPLVFMATWLFDVDSVQEDKIRNIPYLYINIYNPDITELPRRISIMIFPMKWEVGPYKGQKGKALVGYNYILDGVQYNYILKEIKYVRLPGVSQQIH